MLKPILGGCGLGVGLFFLAAGVGAACGAPQLVECQLSAVKALPDDPGEITPYDTLGLIQRLKACRLAGDAGP